MPLFESINSLCNEIDKENEQIEMKNYTSNSWAYAIIN
jgi:hypothetical protein